MLNEKHFKTLIFSGVDLRSFGLYLKRRFIYNVPSWNVKFYDVAGKSGKIASSDGTFNNVTETYDFWMYRKDRPYSFTDEDVLRSLTDWLSLHNNYDVLTDSWHKDSYTYAICTGISGLKRRADGFLEGRITFSRIPWWYLTSGQFPTEYTLSSTLTDALINPTPYDSEPKFELEVTGSGRLELEMYHGEELYETYIIDISAGTRAAVLEDGNFKVDGVERNDLISFDKLPKFSKSNQFKATMPNGMSVNLKIYPRWRRI